MILLVITNLFFSRGGTREPIDKVTHKSDRSFVEKKDSLHRIVVLVLQSHKLDQGGFEPIPWSV